MTALLTNVGIGGLKGYAARYEEPTVQALLIGCSRAFFPSRQFLESGPYSIETSGIDCEYMPLNDRSSGHQELVEKQIRSTPGKQCLGQRSGRATVSCASLVASARFSTSSSSKTREDISRTRHTEAFF